MLEIPETAGRPIVSGTLPALSVSALGVVFGDVGTSPLYTLKTVLGMTGGAPEPSMVLGVLSLVIWTLVIVTTVKYVTVASANPTTSLLPTASPFRRRCC